MRASKWVRQTYMRSESKEMFTFHSPKVAYLVASRIDRLDKFRLDRFEYEHVWCDPKESELCVASVKSGETLMEARSGADVQIAHLSCV